MKVNDFDRFERWARTVCDVDDIPLAEVQPHVWRLGMMYVLSRSPRGYIACRDILSGSKRELTIYQCRDMLLELGF